MSAFLVETQGGEEVECTNGEETGAVVEERGWYFLPVPSG